MGLTYAWIYEKYVLGFWWVCGDTLGNLEEGWKELVEDPEGIFGLDFGVFWLGLLCIYRKYRVNV